MTQLSITAIDNKNLFSNYYLDNQIKNNPEWKKDEHKAAFSEVKKLYDTEKDFLPSLNEKQLEQRFFAPIFKILNHTVEVNEGTESQEFPDYAFFPERSSLDDAHKNKGTISFYNNAFAIGEVKRWGIELDRFGRDERDRKRNPSLQIWIYLHDVSPKWGILSNGAKWRLYCKDRRRDDYYEIDLPTLLAKDEPKNVEEFRYFYYFFRREAFLPSADGRIFLEDVLKGSADYANDIGDDLKENVYKAMKKVAEGFFQWPENRLDVQNHDAREMVQKNTMILLYRLLFLLFAEGKGLLDLRVPRYESYSFDKLKKMVKEKQDGPMQDRYLPVGMELQSRLKSLCRLIDHGSEALGIPKNEFYVPAYNGGLFDPQKHPDLEKWTIGDLFLADAIDLLSRSRVNGGGRGFVDYSTLEIRHLGSIYEGLLEYKLRIADDDMVVNGGEWVKLEDYNKDRKQKKIFSDFDEFDRVKKGQIYLATDKGERKATGSYYTPDYIVNYIVKNTVGPVVEEKWKEAEAKKQSYMDATLSVRVLDPAMGSGHFLVGSIEFLAGKLLVAAQKDIEAGRLSEDAHLTPDWARREVVAHCIYGVDLNELAVELAKVGLWLTTISKYKPLSFLDHRLKQGNSLIGARLIELAYYPKKISEKGDKRQRKLPSFITEIFIKHLIGKISELEKIGDDKLEDIKRKERVFTEFKELDEYKKAKAIANVHAAVFFGNEVIPIGKKDSANVYYDLMWSLQYPSNWEPKTRQMWFKQAQEIAEQKSFFHWELEFPEIFFEGGAPKENPGWDAVVGNPPYVSNWELTSHDSELPATLERFYTAVVSGHWDLYVLFSYRAISLTNSKGLHSFIVPNSFSTEKYGVKLREHLLTKCKIVQLVDFGQHLVFEEVARQYLIYVVGTTFVKDNISKIIKYELGEFEQAFSIPQNQFLEFSNYSLRVDLKDSDIAIKSKLERIHEKLGSLCCINVGVVAHSKVGSPIAFKKDDVISLQDGLGRKKYLEGSDIHRYESNWNGLFLDYDGKREYFHRPKFPELFESPKIMVRRVSGANNAMLSCYDEEKYYTNDNVIHVVLWTKKIQELQPPDNFEISEQASKYDLRFIAAILNSRLNSYYFSSFLATDTLQSSYTGVYPEDLRKLPIRRISFTTPPARCAALFEEAKALYTGYLDASSGTAPDSLKILDFVSARLSATPEESDVVHDLLAHLAEQMIEMNREKNAEIKGFLEWLERELGAHIDVLTNRTILKQYHELDFDGFLSILKKNKKKISANLSGKDFQKNLMTEFEKSRSKLAPLTNEIKATDDLIDAIVYRLYGLTEEEKKIVEGSISGEKNVEGTKT